MSEENILPVSIEEEVEASYIDYAMSVIVGRALPDVRDGLKPVHRRILYAMHAMGLTHNKPHKKSARITGECLGKYHPHGDAAVYDALVKMAQPFSLRYPLVDGQGNFGSIDGDEAAAMRYTEARLSSLAEELLSDMDKETIDFVPNFDETIKEPAILPAKIPNLLINGSAGIAVGMATNMPPHNLSEVIDGINLMIDKPDATTDELMSRIKAPDFPTYGTILGLDEVKKAYETGRGTIRVRAGYKLEKKGKRKILVFNEVPYHVNKSSIVESIANFKEPQIAGVRDESDKKGTRIVVELKSNANPKVVLNKLYANTKLDTTFGVINLALVNGEPKVLPLTEMIKQFISHRKEVVKRRTGYELRKSEKRAHIVNGLRVALGDISKVVGVIKRSDDRTSAQESLIAGWGLSKDQSNAILEMKLNKLTSLEIKKLSDEYEDLTNKIRQLKKILASEHEILKIIKEELTEMKEKYGDPRRTRIAEKLPDLAAEDLIEEEKLVIILSSKRVKSLPVNTFKRQKRGGKGLMSIEKDGSISAIHVTSNLNTLLFITDKCKAYKLKAHKIPIATRQSKGKLMSNLLPLDGEEIVAMLPVENFGGYIVFATENGYIKRTPCSDFSSNRNGIVALSLKNDRLIDVGLSHGNDEIMLATKQGKAIRFCEKDLRAMGRHARGVKGISLAKNDRVVDMEIVKDGSTILTVTEDGYGRRAKISDYRMQRRGGSGVTNGPLTACIKHVSEDDEILISSSTGMVIREAVSEIPVQRRNTRGVKMIRLANANDRVVKVAKM